MKEFLGWIDKVVIRTVASVHVVGGAYLLSPIYLDNDKAIESLNKNSNMYDAVNSLPAIEIYGFIAVVSGLFLIYTTLNRNHSAKLLRYALFTYFIVDIYSIVVSTSQWLPPQYWPKAAGTIIIGSYWLWVRAHEREDPTR